MKKPIVMKLIKIDAHNRTVSEDIVTFEKSEDKIKYMYTRHIAVYEDLLLHGESKTQDELISIQANVMDDGNAVGAYFDLKHTIVMHNICVLVDRLLDID